MVIHLAILSIFTSRAAARSNRGVASCWCSSEDHRLQNCLTLVFVFIIASCCHIILLASFACNFQCLQIFTSNFYFQILLPNFTCKFHLQILLVFQDLKRNQFFVNIWFVHIFSKFFFFIYLFFISFFNSFSFFFKFSENYSL